ncbi:hypothetical protein [Donghicola sp. XS_ASV15]|uniref:hypothetical protein n=1 Tax=Donghicola sp. XS_ASV15 TaxID=3241295 RepID=UPI003516574D
MKFIKSLVGCAAASVLAACVAGAGTNEYGGYDIVGGMGIVESPYAEVRGWNVVYGFDGNRPAYCAAETGTGTLRWRLGYDGGQWQLAIPSSPSGPNSDWSSNWEVDGVARPISGIATENWTIAWLGLEELDRVRQGNVMIIDIGRESAEKQLYGTAAVVTKILECQERSGVEWTDPDLAPQAAIEPVSECPDEGPRFAGSGVCQGRAVNYLSRYPEEPPFALPGQSCRWVLREAALPGGDRFLLYFAAQCDQKTAKLDVSASNRFAELTVSESAYDIPPRVLAEIYASHGKGASGILQRAKEWSQTPAEMSGCFVVQTGTDPVQYQVDNVSPAQSKAMMNDGPRGACGPRGLDQDSPSFWTVIGDELWYLTPSHEAYKDIHVPSLTVLTQDGSGGYVASGY